MLKVLGARVLVRRDGVEGEKTLASGLVIPESAQDLPLTATVVGVGSVPQDHPDYRTMCDLTPGVRVMLTKYTGVTVKVDEQVLAVVPASDILGVLS